MNARRLHRPLRRRACARKARHGNAGLRCRAKWSCPPAGSRGTWPGPRREEIPMSVGETIALDELERDPYPIYARLRDEEAVSWVPAVGLWLVTRHEDVRRVASEPDLFTAET